ncbi:hypothetical protein BG418_28845 [Streptomyces sp. CBMA152]|nr:hypothetical protein [Streptomyces sp. CBMA152]
MYLSQGRANFNAPLTGRFDEETKAYGGEEVVVTDARVYRRPAPRGRAGGPWESFDASTAEGGIPLKNLRGYAQLLVDHGARPVVADEEGVGPVQLLAARIRPVDLKPVDAVAAGNLDGVGVIDTEVRLDDQGRVVRVEQKFVGPRGGATIQSTVTLRDFEPPVKVSAPEAS